eukprot:1160065-Pelagomonas_calceolata.AAC.3
MSTGKTQATASFLEPEHFPCPAKGARAREHLKGQQARGIKSESKVTPDVHDASVFQALKHA